MELCPFRDSSRFQSRLEFFPPGRPRETPGTQHLPCLLPLSLQQDLPTPFPGGLTAGPASLTGPAHTLPLVCTIPPAGSSRKGTPGACVVPCGTGCKEWWAALWQVRQNQSASSCANTWKQFPCWYKEGFQLGKGSIKNYSMVCHPILLNSCFPEPQESPRSLEGTSQACPYLGHSTSHGATQMLWLHIPIF